MTRFKEQKRIDQAIQHQNSDELLWALEYCEMRLKIAKMGAHKKYWHKQIKNVKKTLNISKG